MYVLTHSNYDGTGLILLILANILSMLAIVISPPYPTILPKVEGAPAHDKLF